VRALLLGALLAPLFAAPAFAHHSTTAYDHTRTVALKGVVREFQWTNPHSWIQVLVTDAQGATTEWSIETGAPNLNVRHGWKKTDLKPGDKVTLVIYPIRDGSAHGTLSSITLPDGRVLDGAADFIPKDLAKNAGSTPAPGNPQAPGAGAQPAPTAPLPATSPATPPKQ
jgi:hypothetical protein